MSTMTITDISPTITVPERSERHLGGMLALIADEPVALPLVSVRVRASVAGDCCRTVVEQRFRNEHDVALGATHIFPLPPGGAVTEMELVAGDRTVRASCRQREEAEQVFEQAREAGHRAALLTEERADVHTLHVTNLPPKTDVCVRIVVFERLEHADGRHLWRFPTVIAPRYLPGAPIGHDGPGVLPDTDVVPDASRLQPPLRLEGGTTLDIEVTIAGPLTAVESSLHAVRMTLESDQSGGVRVAPSGSATLDRDFVVAFTSAESTATTVRAWSDGAHTLVVVEPPVQFASQSLPRDAVFVVDISGSMGGAKIDAARRAVSGALHGLAEGDRFAIVAFDNRIEQFSAHPVDYTDESLTRADRWIGDLRARGGTEMLPAVRAALAGATPPGRLRTVLLITDGQVWNESELVAAVAARGAATRLFTMGIDTAVSSGLLQRLARVGGGTCELLTPFDDIEAAAAGLEARFGTPIVDDVSVAGAEAADGRPTTLFAGRPVSRLIIGSPATLLIRGRSADGDWSARATPVRITTPLGALWARERVSWLEDQLVAEPQAETELRREIVSVALAAGIASRYTAFVAVDTSVTETGERVEIVQPVELPLAWDERFLRSPGDSLMGPPLACASPRMHAADAGAAYELRDAPAHGFRADTLRTLGVALSGPSVPRDEQPPAGAAPFGRQASHGAEPADPLQELCGEIARLQRVDGSIVGDVARTSAGLAALVLAGNTRSRGIRRRTVDKAARWLRGHADDAWAPLALDMLQRAETGESLDAIRVMYWDRLLGLPDFAAMACKAWPDGS